ncbi:MAG: hypothetical protein WD534_13515 [Phycisphaeraceae bacterium]
MRRQSTWQVAPAAFALAGLVGVAGCQSTGHRAAPPLPTLSEIESRVTPSEPPETDRPAERRRGIATIQQIDLPLQTDLDESWDLANERVLTQRARQVWNGNGIRMGLLAMDEVDPFFEPLPYVLGVHRTRIVGGRHPSSVRTSPALREPVQVDLAGVAGDGQEQVVELDRGRVRLLIRMEANPVGGVTVELTPHHQLPGSSLIPRDPLEKELDGRVFDELAVAFDLNRNDVLVVGLHWPWSTDADEADDEEEEGEEEEEEDGRERIEQRFEPEEEGPLRLWTVDEDAAPELPRHLGRTLFAGRRAGGRMQSVLLIQVEPAAGE